MCPSGAIDQAASTGSPTGRHSTHTRPPLERGGIPSFRRDLLRRARSGGFRDAPHATDADGGMRCKRCYCSVDAGGWWAHAVECAGSAAADVDLYYDSEIELGGGSNLIGLATNDPNGGWELFVNYPKVESDEAYRR